MENVKVTVEEPSSVKRKIAVEVPAEEVDRAFGDTLKKYRRHAVVPGFRKGKVPVNVVENRYRDDIKEDVTRDLLPASYEAALKETGLKPLSEPEVGDLKIEPGSPLSYTAEFEIAPVFDLGEYTGIELDGKDMEVGDDEVAALLEEVRAGQATLTKLEEDRGLRTGDVAVIDFEGISDGKPIPGGSAKEFPLTIGSDTFLPGFEDSLVGSKVGEEREFFLKLPEDFQEADFAGKEAGFKVKVAEIRERVLPDLDDDFAKDVGEYESLDDLKAKLRVNLGLSKEADSRNELREQMLTRLVEAHDFEAPPSMVMHRKAMMLGNIERNLVMRGVAKEEIEKNRGKMLEDTAAPAEKKVKASIILDAIASKEGVEVSEEELAEEIGRIAAQNKIEPDEARRRMVENDSLDNLRDILREEKTINFILDKAKIQRAGAAGQPEKGKDDK